MRSSLAALAVVSSSLIGSAILNAGPANLSRIVVVGDSLSAGVQNFSLFDAATAPFAGGQQYGFMAVVAHQAHHDLTLPLFLYPGIPANFANPALAPLYGRENPTVQATNLSVPGFTIGNAIANPFPGNPANLIDGISSVILGTPQYPNTVLGCGPIPTGRGYIVSELSCAIGLKPTVVLASIGNNDALQALTLGLQPTDPQLFAAQYRLFILGLASTGAKVVATNIPDVTAIPYLLSYQSFVDTCGIAALPPNTTNTDFIVANLTAPLSPPDLFDPCKNPIVRSGTLVQQAQSAVTAYNRVIANVVTSAGGVVVDANRLFATTQRDGYLLSNGKVLTSNPGGGLFSLDRIHPTNTGYAILANATITIT